MSVYISVFGPEGSEYKAGSMTYVTVKAVEPVRANKHFVNFELLIQTNPAKRLPS